MSKPIHSQRPPEESHRVPALWRPKYSTTITQADVQALRDWPQILRRATRLRKRYRLTEIVQAPLQMFCDEDAGLSEEDRIGWGHLCDCARDRDRWLVWAGLDYLGKQMQVKDPDTVTSRCRKLERAGWIYKQQVRLGRGQGSRNIYVLLHKVPLDEAEQSDQN